MTNSAHASATVLRISFSSEEVFLFGFAFRISVWGILHQSLKLFFTQGGPIGRKLNLGKQRICINFIDFLSTNVNAICRLLRSGNPRFAAKIIYSANDFLGQKTPRKAHFLINNFIIMLSLLSGVISSAHDGPIRR